jgi:uncharacterized protein YhfF
VSLWQEYVADHPEHRDERPPIESFGDSPAMADELLALVIDGPKRATAGLVAAYEVDGADLPSVGSHWVVTDGSGAERVVLRSTDIRLGPVDSVDDSFAYDEGEGDRTRDSWLHDHREFFERQVAERGMATPDGLDALICVFERFVIVWPPELAD